MEKALRCKRHRSILRRKTKKKYLKKYMTKEELDQVVRVFGKEYNQTIVVKNVSTGARLFELLMATLFYLFRFLVWGGICIALTMLINILLNDQLRILIIHYYEDLFNLQMGL